MASFYGLKLGNGAWLDKGGSQDPVNKIASDVQNARIYTDLSSAKMQQTEFIKNRQRFPENTAFQQSCEVMRLNVANIELAVGDSFGGKPQKTKRPPEKIDQPVAEPQQRKEQPRENFSLVDLMKRKR